MDSECGIDKYETAKVSQCLEGHKQFSISDMEIEHKKDCTSDRISNTNKRTC